MDMQRMAQAYAAGAHAAVGQRRKYTGRPYIEHPIAVAGLVASVGGCDGVLEAALLHDVIEDTKVTADDLRRSFGEQVAQWVLEVTDVSRPEDGNRALRKAIDLQHIAKASYEGKTIKLADLIDNTSTIVKYDPEFARVYMREKKALLEVLKDGNETLFHRASRIVEDYFRNEGASD